MSYHFYLRRHGSLKLLKAQFIHVRNLPKLNLKVIERRHRKQSKVDH